MDAIIGLVFLAALGFMFWTWLEALNVPREHWTAVPCSTLCDGSGYWTKKSWFLLWYVGGFFTCGLLPIGMSVYFHQTLRPAFRDSDRAEDVASAHRGVAAGRHVVRGSRSRATVGAQVDELHELYRRGILTKEELDAKTTALLARVDETRIERTSSRPGIAPVVGENDSSEPRATGAAGPGWRWTGFLSGWRCVTHNDGLCRQCPKLVAHPQRLGRYYGETVSASPPRS